MRALQRSGGIAALVEAAAYVAGFALFATRLDSSAAQGIAGKVGFLVANQQLLSAAAMLLYVITGVALVVLVVALHDRLAAAAPALMPIASSFGIIWAGFLLASGLIFVAGVDAVVALHATDIAAAGNLWQSVAVFQDALGGGSEIVGGLWMLLVSLAVLRSMALPRLLGWFGAGIGIAGVLSLVPGLESLVEVFGLAQILWFAAIGIVLLRDPSPEQRPSVALAG